MAPIRRYLRITKYSVLECRIYLDNPALAETWLLNPRNPILPRVIESVRPLVLPKLREENKRSQKKGKKKGVKDVVVEEDFEVSIFLTETSTRHSLLFKQKHFKDLTKKSIKPNSSKLMGATNDTAIDVEDAPAAPGEESAEDTPIVLREGSEEDAVNLDDLPEAEAEAEAEEVGDDNSSEDSLFVSENEPRRSKRPRASTDSEPSTPPKRRKDKNLLAEDQADDKKKLAMETSYDGFSIYGCVLCLVVKRKDKKGKGLATPGQAQIEDWISSTQMPAQEDD